MERAVTRSKQEEVPYNTPGYCHSAMWFARELEVHLREPLIAPLPPQEGIFHYLSADRRRRALMLADIIWIAAEINAMLDANRPDRILITRLFPEGSVAEIAAPGMQLSALGSVGNDLLALDVASASLRRFSGIVAEAPALPRIASDRAPQAIEIAPRSSAIPIEGLVPTPQHRFVTWTDTTPDEVSVLMWLDETDFVWLGRIEAGRLRMEPATVSIASPLGISTSSSALRISSACSAGQQIYLTDAAEGRVLRAAREGSGLVSNVILDPHSDALRSPKGRAVELRKPTGIGLYAMSMTNLKADVAALFNGESSALANQRFLVVVNADPTMSCVVTLREERDGRVMPLMGRFPDAAKGDHLANHSFGSHERVVMGPQGTLIFWSPGSERWLVLRPGTLVPGLSHKLQPKKSPRSVLT